MTFFNCNNFARLLHNKAAASLIVFGLWIVLGASGVRAQAITEDFANIATLPAAGWFTQNNSVPVGTTGWFQGNATVFPAQAGATTSYIGANFNNTTGTNTISNWLLTPNRTFSNGDVVKFWTRTVAGSPFPDRLEVRFSSNGASTNVGVGSAAVGDFTVVLATINGPLDVGGYPEAWTEFTITVSGLAAPTSGRIGFRYFVIEGGPTGDNSNYIGIDTFSYTPGGGGGGPAADQSVDFNDDGKTDYVVARNSNGTATGQITWYINLNGVGGTQAVDWGLGSDFLLAADFDGDGKDDVSSWRPASGTFYILNSSNFTARVEQFGVNGDDPTVVGDYNNDAADDLAVYRAGASPGQQSTWFYRTSPGGPVAYVPWGSNPDAPAPGDYDGDGRYDFVVQKNNGDGAGRFWRLFGTGTTDQVVFGLASDLIVPGDYDGDGKTDIAVVRGIGGVINWFYEPSGTAGVQSVQSAFGNSTTDFVAQGDYNGDGRTDFAIWRPSATPGGSAFWVQTSSTATVSTFTLGSNGDYPVANFNSH